MSAPTGARVPSADRPTPVHRAGGGTARPRHRRGPLLVAATAAAVGGTAIYAVALPEQRHLSAGYGTLFTVLAAAQLATVGAAIARPGQRGVLRAAVPALLVVVVWALVRVLDVLPDPDPWEPVDRIVGFTDTICAALEAVAVLGLVAIAVRRPPPGRSLPRRLAGWALGIPPLAVVLLGTVIGVAAAGNAFGGTGLPADTVVPLRPGDLPAGRVSTVEYCRPDAVPLAMDLYTPPAGARGARPAPVAIYVHGGGLALGDRRLDGLGATLAQPDAALFVPLQQQLNARGFLVASIDYRLAPAAPWPAQIEDAKCAVRFLRANAGALGVDPTRIGVWGDSAGGQLAVLLGAAGPAAGFDVGQYVDRSSAVQAVVDMFGPADLTDLGDSTPFGRFIVQAALGSSTSVRRSASPDTYLAPGAAPTLVLHGTDDPLVRPRHSIGLAQRLRAAGVPVTLVQVRGTGHRMDTPGQQPAPAEITATVVDFLTRTLRQPLPPRRG